MRLGYIKDENGKLVRKFVTEKEYEENDEILYPANAMFGGYDFADAKNMQEVKEALLEKMIRTIRELAELDSFWIVRTVDDMWNGFQNSVLSEMHKLSKEEWLEQQRQEVKDGKGTVAWKMELPQMVQWCKRDEAEKIQKKLEEICKINN